MTSHRSVDKEPTVVKFGPKSHPTIVPAANRCAASFERWAACIVAIAIIEAGRLLTRFDRAANPAAATGAIVSCLAVARVSIAAAGRASAPDRSSASARQKSDATNARIPGLASRAILP